MVANPARGPVEQGKCFFPVPVRACMIIRPRETGSTVPSRVSPLILHTQAESSIINMVCIHGIPPAFRDGLLISRQPPPGQSRNHQVSQMRTDDVHCRESSDTRLIVFKVAWVTGATLTVGTVDMWDTHKVGGICMREPVGVESRHARSRV